VPGVMRERLLPYLAVPTTLRKNGSGASASAGHVLVTLPHQLLPSSPSALSPRAPFSLPAPCLCLYPTCTSMPPSEERLSCVVASNSTILPAMGWPLWEKLDPLQDRNHPCGRAIASKCQSCPLAAQVGAMVAGYARSDGWQRNGGPRSDTGVGSDPKSSAEAKGVVGKHIASWLTTPCETPIRDDFEPRESQCSIHFFCNGRFAAPLSDNDRAGSVVLPAQQNGWSRQTQDFAPRSDGDIVQVLRMTAKPGEKSLDSTVGRGTIWIDCSGKREYSGRPGRRFLSPVVLEAFRRDCLWLRGLSLAAGFVLFGYKGL
jgi:hypothetical protein